MPTKTFFRLRDERQEAVLRSAIHEFAEKGFARAKVSDIAKNAGVSKGSIFQYFEDKKQLFLYCAQWGLEMFIKKIDAAEHIGDMDIFEYFQNPSYRTEILREEGELALFMQVAINEPGLLDDTMKNMYNIGNVYTKKMLNTSQERGVVRKDISDDILLEFFNAVTERFSRRWFTMYIGDPTAEISDKAQQAINEELGQMLELIRKGMG